MTPGVPPQPFSPAALAEFVRQVTNHMVTCGLAPSWVATECAAVAQILSQAGEAGLPAAARRLQEGGLGPAWNALLQHHRAPALADMLAPYVLGSALDMLSGNGAVGRCLAARRQLPVSLIERHTDYAHCAPALAGTLPWHTLAHLPDRTFDTVLLCTVLHHEQQPLATLAAAARLARQRILIVENPVTAEHDADFHLLMDLFFNVCLNKTGLPSPAQHLETSTWERQARAFGEPSHTSLLPHIPGIPLPHVLIVVDQRRFDRCAA